MLAKEVAYIKKVQTKQTKHVLNYLLTHLQTYIENEMDNTIIKIPVIDQYYRNVHNTITSHLTTDNLIMTLQRRGKMQQELHYKRLKIGSIQLGFQILLGVYTSKSPIIEILFPSRFILCRYCPRYQVFEVVQGLFSSLRFTQHLPKLMLFPGSRCLLIWKPRLGSVVLFRLGL